MPASAFDVITRTVLLEDVDVAAVEPGVVFGLIGVEMMRQAFLLAVQSELPDRLSKAES
jgi:hypothetical protein